MDQEMREEPPQMLETELERAQEPPVLPEAVNDQPN
jgi:hypothetical protein